jgi:hypothetical protein
MKQAQHQREQTVTVAEIRLREPATRRHRAKAFV